MSNTATRTYAFVTTARASAGSQAELITFAERARAVEPRAEKIARSIAAALGVGSGTGAVSTVFTSS